MAASIQLNFRSIKPHFILKPVAKAFPKPSRIRCAAATPTNLFSCLFGFCLATKKANQNNQNEEANNYGIEFSFQEMPLGGAALHLTGVPLPEETLSAAQKADAVLLGAVGGYKWDKNERHLKPEIGLLQLREGLKVFANLRPATVLPQLVDSSTLKKDVAEGVDLMVVFILENQGDLVLMKRVRILASTLRCMLLMRLVWEYWYSYILSICNIGISICTRTWTI